MTKSIYTRRQMLQLSTAAATAVTAGFTLPQLTAQQTPQNNLYAQLLQTWCDGLLAHQSTNPDPALRGALLCPKSNGTLTISTSAPKASPQSPKNAPSISSPALKPSPSSSPCNPTSQSKSKSKRF